MNKRIIITKKQFNKVINPYLRTMSGLMENRRTLPKKVMNAPIYPFVKGQKCVNGVKFNINEGLTRTYPTVKTVEYIKSVINRLPNKDEGNIEFFINDYKGGLDSDYDVADFVNVVIDGYIVTQDLYDTIVKLFDSCGYYESSVYWSKEGDDLIIQVEPKFQNESYSSTEIGDYLYHITTLNGWRKIQKNGFVPKSKNAKFNYPPRCYFFTKDDDEFMIEFMVTSDKLKKGDKAVILTIDTSKVKDTVKFWQDPLFVGADIAVYTYENIPLNTVVDTKEIIV